MNDANKTWRMIYRVDTDAIVIIEVFEKKTTKTPVNVIDTCRQRMKAYEASRA